MWDVIWISARYTADLCLVQDRPAGGVTPMKSPFAQDHAPIDKLVDVVTTIKPTAIIGNWPADGYYYYICECVSGCMYECKGKGKHRFV